MLRNEFKIYSFLVQILVTLEYILGLTLSILAEGTILHNNLTANNARAAGAWTVGNELKCRGKADCEHESEMYARFASITPS